MILLLIILLALSILFTAMSIALKGLSVSHVRYWARKGDKLSKNLYPLKARGSAVLLTIELLRSIFISGSLVLLASTVNSLIAWLLGAAVLFVAFVVLSELYLRPLGIRLLGWSSAWLLNLSQALKFIMLPLGRMFDRFIEDAPVTITRDELMNIINSVQVADTDLSADELRIVKHSLMFGDKVVHDVMTPKSVMQTAKVDDVISPILLDELHKSGHSRIPVFDSNGEQAVGVLYIKDLIDVKSRTLVSELMHKPIHFVNEERELDHVLQAFIKTKQHMFLVVNSFAEITGLITIEDIIEQVLGKPIIDEFDKYDSMRDVAEAKAKVIKKQMKLAD